MWSVVRVGKKAHNKHVYMVYRSGLSFQAAIAAAKKVVHSARTEDVQIVDNYGNHYTIFGGEWVMVGAKIENWRGLRGI